MLIIYGCHAVVSRLLVGLWPGRWRTGLKSVNRLIEAALLGNEWAEPVPRFPAHKYVLVGTGASNSWSCIFVKCRAQLVVRDSCHSVFSGFTRLIQRNECRVSFWETDRFDFQSIFVCPQWRRHVTGLLCAHGVVLVFEKWHRRLENEGDGNIAPSAWNAQ